MSFPRALGAGSRSYCISVPEAGTWPGEHVSGATEAGGHVLLPLACGFLARGPGQGLVLRYGVFGDGSRKMRPWTRQDPWEEARVAEEGNRNQGRTGAGQEKGPRRTKQEPNVKRRWGVGAAKPEQSEGSGSKDSERLDRLSQRISCIWQLR